MSKIRRSGVNVTSLLAASCATLASSFVSTANGLQAAPVLSPGTLKEIVVTAETYAPSAQTTPISLTAITGTQYVTNAGDGRSDGPELEFAARISADWTVYLNGTWTRAAITSPSIGYVGSSWDEAFSVIRLPGYVMANVRVTLAADKWTSAVFVTNLTNEVPWVSANNTSFSFNIGSLTRISTLQPMTIGTRWSYSF